MTTDLAVRLEQTLFDPLATRIDLERLCRDARESGTRAVCVPGSRVAEARHYAQDSDLKVCCLVGFPFGCSDPDVKRYEAEVAIDNGAQELELVPALARVKEGDYKFVLREMRDIVESADELPVKVVIESALWTDDELREFIGIVLDSGAQYLSTSAGFLPSKTSAEHIRALRELAGPQFGIKASAVKTIAEAQVLLDAGADLFHLKP
jgi:deoxyribose-phosphate aldolase